MNYINFAFFVLLIPFYLLFLVDVQLMCTTVPLYCLFQFPTAALAKYHKLGGLKQQKFIHSQFYLKPGYCQGRHQGRILISSSFWLPQAFLILWQATQYFPVSTQPSSLCASVFKFPFSYQDICHIELAPTVMTSS